MVGESCIWKEEECLLGMQKYQMCYFSLTIQIPVLLKRSAKTSSSTHGYPEFRPRHG